MGGGDGGEYDGGIKFSNLGRIFFKIYDGGRRANRERSNMYILGGGDYLEFPKWLRITAIEKRNLICFICSI